MWQAEQEDQLQNAWMKRWISKPFKHPHGEARGGSGAMSNHEVCVGVCMLCVPFVYGNSLPQFWTEANNNCFCPQGCFALPWTRIRGRELLHMEGVWALDTSLLVHIMPSCGLELKAALRCKVSASGCRFLHGICFPHCYLHVYCRKCTEQDSLHFLASVPCCLPLLAGVG